MHSNDTRLVALGLPQAARAMVVAAAILAAAAVAQAADGVLEINQTCAVQTGCFAGDTAGFPVTITQPGSYVLTGNLSGFQAEAVRITAHDVTVNLGGFTILGPGTCSGTPPSCSGAGSTVGVGSETQIGIPIRHGLTVRNGHIRGVATGVLVGNASIVEDLRLRDLSSRGIVALNGCRIARNAISNVGGDFAITAPGVGSLISDNAISNTAAVAITAGLDAGYADNVVSDSVGGLTGSGRGLSANLCDGHLCGAPVPIQRRYYVTTQYVSPVQAPTACATGFHMASLWEIRNTSALRYDTDLGWSDPTWDGEGPDSVLGWVRTGGQHPFSGGAYGQPGMANCNEWSTTSTYYYGTVAGVVDDRVVKWDQTNWTEPPPGQPDTNDLSWTWGWRSDTFPCDEFATVWCVQDE